MICPLFWFVSHFFFSWFYETQDKDKKARQKHKQGFMSASASVIMAAYWLDF